MCLLKAHPQNLLCAVPFPISRQEQWCCLSAGSFSLSQLGRDPHFTFAALMGGQPCTERCCITPASPQHPARLLQVPIPGAPSHPCQGTAVMWHQGRDHMCLGGSPLPEEHAEGVDEAALRKASATEPEIRHKASARVAWAARAEVKERDWAGSQGTAPNPCGTSEQHALPRKAVAVPDVQKGKLRGREQHRDSPKLAQWQSWHSDPAPSWPPALPIRRLHPALGRQQCREEGGLPQRQAGLPKRGGNNLQERLLWVCPCPSLQAVTGASAPTRNPSSAAQSAGGHPHSPGKRLASACMRKERETGS